jgi:hypothetical protein
MTRRRKLLGIGAESPASDARFVGKNWGKRTRCLKTKTTPFTDLILHTPQIFTSLTFALENTTDLPKRRAENLLKPLPKN